ncbi:hypothetical protein F5882DRAFT_378796 [Hyaloscypha sp. PMI_1271]|nr:hypothetical protein F5882DRAFT_378796 [Hyaloscypha sp. PMI_1271]
MAETLQFSFSFSFLFSTKLRGIKGLLLAVLQNPNASLPGGIKVYRKEYHDTRRDEIIPARYTLCYNDTFEILTTIYEKLMHTSLHLSTHDEFGMAHPVTTTLG